MDGFRERGGIDLAADSTELEYMRLLADYAESWGIETALLEPSEVADLNPDIDTDRIEGALHVPSGGPLQTFDCLDALREAAQDDGVSFHERTAVTDIETTDGAVAAVVTDRGRIETERVLVAANIWSPLLGEMVGVDVPLVPCEHQYVLTEPVEGLAGAPGRQWEGGFRYRRGGIYAGPHGRGYGIGNYNHDPLLVDPADIDSYEAAMEHPPVNEFFVGDESRQADSIPMPASREFTEEDFRAGWEHAVDVVPPLEGADIKEAFNGMFCFTPDGMPVLGPAESVDGFWLAAAVWVTHAGGVGRAMAEWMTQGYPELDVSGCHVSRFQPHETAREFVRTRAAESYRTVHDIEAAHPRAPVGDPRGVRRSPFYHAQSRLDAEFTASAGLERVRRYWSNEALLDAAGSVERTLSWLTLDEPGAVVVAGTPTLDGEETVGYATSAGYGYSVDAGVVAGYLPPDRADPETALDVRFQGERYPATVREAPLLDPEGERLRG
jgi:glycine/D-amino acid oxidase-like deaminating enzyme